MGFKFEPLAPMPMPLATHDKFGLPSFTLLESDDEREERIAIVERFVAQAYKAVAGQLTEDRARELFVSVAKRPRGKHGKRKFLSSDRDWTLLGEFDAEVARCEGDPSIMARVSKRIFAEKGDKFGASATAIEKQIRKLLAERKKNRARDAERARQWRERYKTATGSYPAPTLLELASAAEGGELK